MKPKPKPPEVYVQRSRFGKRGPAVMASHFATGTPGKETGSHDDALVGAIMELRPATATDGAHVVIRRPLKVKLGDLVSLEQFKSCLSGFHPC